MTRCFQCHPGEVEQLPWGQQVEPGGRLFDTDHVNDPGGASGPTGIEDSWSADPFHEVPKNELVLDVVKGAVAALLA